VVEGGAVVVGVGAVVVGVGAVLVIGGMVVTTVSGDNVVTAVTSSTSSNTSPRATFFGQAVLKSPQQLL